MRDQGRTPDALTNRRTILTPGTPERLTRRLAKLEHAARGRAPATTAFTSLLALPVSDADGRPPGAYPAGPGSTAGTLVYDAAGGDPVVPGGALAPRGVLIVCPPKDPPP